MPSTANVVIHQSQFPENVRRDLIESLRMRRVNHKFHYDSVKQTNKWLALHQAYSPSRNDEDCEATYDRAFAAASNLIPAKRVYIAGLGCGGGRKDARLLRCLFSAGKKVFYQPLDVSLAMVLVARQAVAHVVSDDKCFPIVYDLAMADDLSEILRAREAFNAIRLISFFGMIPNFEPENILPKLSAAVRTDDWLLFSANLAPGKDYAAGVAKILPQYDNELTREWLLMFLLDLGVERGDGELCFNVEIGVKPLRRVVAQFRFKRDRRLTVEGETFVFHRSESIRLFFSYRYTPKLVRAQLAKHGLRVYDQWITQSGEEGVFLCRRQ